MSQSEPFERRCFDTRYNNRSRIVLTRRKIRRPIIGRNENMSTTLEFVISYAFDWLELFAFMMLTNKARVPDETQCLPFLCLSIK